MTKNAGNLPRMRSVRIGEIVTGIGSEPIKTVLGSCIGLALFDWSNNVGGLAHILLPTSQGHQGPPGKFVDTAVPELIRKIEKQNGKASQLSAKIVGGANMLKSSSSNSIGERNIESTRETLKLYNIPILASHCGKEFGRRMTLFPGTGRVFIDVVGYETIEI